MSPAIVPKNAGEVSIQLQIFFSCKISDPQRPEVRAIGAEDAGPLEQVEKKQLLSEEARKNFQLT